MGRRARASGRRPTSSSSSATRAERSFRDSERSCTTSGNETICSTVFRLFSDAYGSWKTICISRRSRRSSRREIPKRSVDSKWTLPDVGSSRRSKQPRERRLARARLADEADRLAAGEHERDVVDRLDDAARPAARRGESGGSGGRPRGASPRGRARCATASCRSRSCRPSLDREVTLRHLLADGDRRRRIDRADLLRIGAARVERTAGRQLVR